MDDASNRRYLLTRRPTGLVDDTVVQLVEEPVPALGEGEAIVRTDWLSIDPTIRVWMRDEESYLPPIPVGDVVRGAGVGEVVASRNEGLPVGATVLGMLGWQDYCHVTPDSMVSVLPDGIDPRDAVGLFGVAGATAYFGLLDLGRPQPGETVVVSGAAGSVGSLVGQIARIHGCRAIGIAGGEAKCRWLVDELGFDAAVDYRSEDVEARLGELCPDGIDVVFENVGGDILDASLAHLALRARVVLCGLISTYNDPTPQPGPRNLRHLLFKRARMEGFIVIDYVDRFLEAILALAGWLGEGRIRYHLDVVEGLEQAPAALNRLFTTSDHTGKLVVKVR